MIDATLAAEHSWHGPSWQRRVARSLVPARIRPRLFGAVRSVRHRGHEVYCPLCEGEFDSFIPHRAVSPGRCPRCGSLERHRLLISFLCERGDLFAGSLSVLHIAPEYGLQRRLRRLGNLTYRSVDLDSPLAMDKADLLNMPYPDGSFDVVICSHVLEHVADDLIALSEIRRVLASDGRAILMSPIDDELSETLEDPTVTSPAERHRVFGQSDHLRRYGRDFAKRVTAAGFAVEVVSCIDGCDPEKIARQGLRRESKLFSNDDIFICRRG
jgi:SAM-dependent methyltransferase